MVFLDVLLRVRVYGHLPPNASKSYIGPVRILINIKSYYHSFLRRRVEHARHLAVVRVRQLVVADGIPHITNAFEELSILEVCRAHVYAVSHLCDLNRLIPLSRTLIELVQKVPAPTPAVELLGVLIEPELDGHHGYACVQLRFVFG